MANKNHEKDYNCYNSYALKSFLVMITKALPAEHTPAGEEGKGWPADPQGLPLDYFEIFVSG